VELNGHGSFWAKAVKADTFILLDTVQFVHSGPSAWIHRAKLPDGKWLTVPVKRPHIVPIKDLVIDWTHYDPHKHFDALLNQPESQKSIEPFENALSLTIGDIMVRSAAPSKLVDWNEYLIYSIASEKGIDCGKFKRASEIEDKFTKARLRFYTPTGRIPFLCKSLGADTYLTGPSWRRYAPNLEKVLNEHGIKLEEVK
jgi:hypothetical protein